MQLPLLLLLSEFFLGNKSTLSNNFTIGRNFVKLPAKMRATNFPLHIEKLFANPLHHQLLMITISWTYRWS